VTDAITHVAVLNALGAALKRVPFAPDWCIPFVLAVAGVALAWATDTDMIEGAMHGLTAVGVHQLIHQAHERDP
jgi:hypothetical protein